MGFFGGIPSTNPTQAQAASQVVFPKKGVQPHTITKTIEAHRTPAGHLFSAWRKAQKVRAPEPVRAVHTNAGPPPSTLTQAVQAASLPRG